MNKENWKKAKAKYYPKKNTVHISAASTEFYPQYLKYYFQYLRIPENATIYFTDRVIKGGVEAWLKENQK